MKILFFIFYFLAVNMIVFPIYLLLYFLVRGISGIYDAMFICILLFVWAVIVMFWGDSIKEFLWRLR
jgi:hypothetical protein